MLRNEATLFNYMTMKACVPKITKRSGDGPTTVALRPSIYTWSLVVETTQQMLVFSDEEDRMRKKRRCEGYREY